MGANPADTQREITRLRGDINAALDEVERRIRGGFRGVAAAEARITTARTSEDVVTRARENPTLLGVGGVVAAGAVTYGAYALVNGLRRRDTPKARLQRGTTQIREELAGRVMEGVERSRRQLERTLPQGILLKLEPERGGYMRISDARLESPKKRGQSTVLKKLVWALLLSLIMAVGSVLARRVADLLWRAMVREEPPSENSEAAT